MKCPSCSTESAGGECPKCGLIFSKWNQRQERAKLEAQEALAALERGPGPAASPDPRRGRIVAGVILGAWLIAMTLVARHYMRNRRIPEGRPILAGDLVPVRDPVTGDMRMMKVESSAERTPHAPRREETAQPEEDAGARVIRESEWVEEEGQKTAPPARTRRTVLPPPPGDE